MEESDSNAEIVFIGEIQYGSLFDPSEELFCEAYFFLAQEWQLLNQLKSKHSIQTQCCAGAVSLFYNLE